MTNAISICGPPNDVRKEILLQLDNVESLKAAAQSCKAFYATILAQRSIIRKVLENEIPASVIPYAYALLKCGWERYSVAPNADKISLLDKVFDGTTDFSAFFPHLKLRWAAALEISSLRIQLVKRLTRRAEKTAFMTFENELNKREEHGRLEAFRKRGLVWSDTEALRVCLAFYRIELHARLFSTTLGAQLNFEMERDFFLRLQPWECEQIMILWRWMIVRTWRPLAILLEKAQDEFWEDYQGPTVYSVGLWLIEVMLTSTSAKSFRKLLRRHVGGSFLLQDSTLFSYDSSGADLHMHRHMHRVTENLQFEEPLEPIDPELGPRSAVFAVYRDGMTYYDGAEMMDDEGFIQARESGRLKVDSLFPAFWDYGRISDADLLPLFARLAFSSYDGIPIESEVEYEDDESDG